MRRAEMFSHPFLPLLLGVVLTAGLAGCGGGTSQVQFTSNQGTGVLSVSISDPPTCKGPLAPSDLQFENVWVTITRVRAHISSSAPDGEAGWVDLVDLRQNPKQIDLLSGSDSQCILSALGSSTGLPPGNYQQIRLYLLSNNPGAGEATPSPNACQGTGGFNCAKPVGEPLRRIELSSQEQSGLKVPPGRIAGGRLQLEAGQAANINIEFNACNSILREGNGKFRLLPTLHAGEVSTTTDTLTGRLVVSGTTAPPPSATLIVLLEQVDADGIDRVVMQTLADAASGNFSFCPLPPGTYDVVVTALDTNGVTYNATIVFGVPTGTNLGDIPLVPEPGPDTSPGTITGVVTTQDTGGQATVADIALSALQSATPSGGSARLVTIPTFGESTVTLSTAADASCPANTDCASFTLMVPASNPNVGTFSSSGTSYTAPTAGDVLYSVNARAFVPASGSTTPNNCSASSVTVDKLEDGATTLTVTAGGSSTAQTLAFTGCQPGI